MIHRFTSLLTNTPDHDTLCLQSLAFHQHGFLLSLRHRPRIIVAKPGSVSFFMYSRMCLRSPPHVHQAPRVRSPRISWQSSQTEPTNLSLGVLGISGVEEHLVLLGCPRSVLVSCDSPPRSPLLDYCKYSEFVSCIMIHCRDCRHIVYNT